MAVPVGTELVCGMCGASFVKEGTTQKFCKDAQCKKDRAKARWQRWYDKEDSKTKSREYQREFRGRNNYARQWEVKSRYGLEWDEYLDLLDRFNHQCPVCFTLDDLCVDHDHKTGTVRGILCRGCNRSLGQLGDSLEAVRRLFFYMGGER